MKSVLISIQPKWCELIASGKKTVEVRKTKPKLETPFKVYIYCTKERRKTDFITKSEVFGYINAPEHTFCNRAKEYDANGKVIGEFVCDKIDEFSVPYPAYFSEIDSNAESIIKSACLKPMDIHAYNGTHQTYGWHITDLIVYDEPRELSEFYAEGDCDCMNCKNCAWFDRGNGYNVEDDCNLAYKGVELHKSLKPITRPPQSWCYVESEDTE